MDKRQKALQKLGSLSKAQQAELLSKMKRDKAKGESSGSGKNLIEPITDCENYRASWGQRSLWLTRQIEGDSAKYNMASGYRFEGALDIHAFTACWQEIVQRHESLRTVFFEIEGEAYQKVLTDIAFGVDRLDLSELNAVEQQAQIEQRIQANAHWKFNLQDGPLLRVELILCGEYSIFLMNVHHIVFDGASKGIILRELAALYAQAKGKTAKLYNFSEVPLTSLSVQYKDFSEWQHRQSNYDQELEYWKEQLGDAPKLIELPLDAPRTKDQGDKGDAERVIIAPEVAEPLRKIGQRNGATNFMTMLAAFSVLLSKYTNQSDMVIGTPIDIRPNEAVHSVVGYFLNTLALRVKPERHLSFEDYLKVVKDTCLQGYQNQNTPFDRLVQELNPQRDTGFAPIFQVMMVFQNKSSHQFGLQDLGVEKISSGTNTTKYDIYLTFVELDGGLEGWLTYNTELFNKNTIQQLLGDFQQLLADIVQHSAQPVGQFALSSGMALVNAQQAIGSPIPVVDTPSSVQAQFLKCVTEQPDSIAVVEGELEISYRDLDSMAGQVASALKLKGVNAGDYVGLHIARSVDIVVAILATLKTGAAFLPLDMALPESRIKHYVQSVQPKLILDEGGIDETSLDNETTVFGWDDCKMLAAEQSPLEDIVQPHPLTPVYCIFTSGSTGTPKAVSGIQSALLNRLQWGWQQYPYQENDVSCLKTNINFVDFIAELFSPLLQGVPSVIFEQSASFDLFEFMSCLSKHSVSRLLVVPSLLQSILEFYPDLKDTLPQLNMVTVSGEALTPDLVDEFNLSMPDAVLLNLYGSSEVSADVTWYPLPKTPMEGRNVPIGKSIDHCQVYLLDSDMNPCPAGTVGELYVSGAGLSGGYLNSAAYTAERFLPNPFLDGQCMFRTGDLARINTVGDFEFCGRFDRQVKIRGIRIDLAEIEQQIQSYEGISKAICTVTEDDSQLNAYIVPMDSGYVDPVWLRGELIQLLPEYMVPSTYTLIDEAPLSVNGKIDLDALPPPDAPVSMHEFIAPESELELQMAVIWCQCLGVNKVGMKDNFFDMGGHSLVATKLVAMIRSEFNVEVMARKVFEMLTFENLVEHVEEKLELLELMQQNSVIESDEDWETVDI